eukprot:scaffold14.g1326.t1
MERAIASMTCLRGWAASRPSGQPRRPGRASLAVRAAASAASKVKQTYVCRECGEQQLQWSGQCKACGAWSTLNKVKMAATSETGGGGGGARAAARFAAGKAAATADAAEGAAWGGARSGGAAPLQRTAWVQEAEPPQRLSDISRRGFRSRWRLHLPGDNGRELSRVLGGGIVPGSLTLVGGEPGVGKSTLLLQMAAMLGGASTRDPPPSGGADAGADAGAERAPEEAAAAGPEDEEGEEERPVLYVSGEESREQIGSRAERMGLADNRHIFLYSATRLDLILDEITRLQPKASAPWGMECARARCTCGGGDHAGAPARRSLRATSCQAFGRRLLRRFPTVVPRTLRPPQAIIVDSIQTVYLDEIPSSAGSVRECATALLHVAKREKVPVFLVGHSGDLAGPRVLEHIVDVVVYMEGGRQQPVRLVRTVKNRYGATDEVGVFQMHDDGMQGATHPPVRMPSGVNKNRLYLLLAVLGKHTEMRPYAVDVHLNVTGGLEMTEPATDLAVTLAIASSYFEQPIARDVAAIGEVGLGGELRPVGHIERRISEAAKLGFRRFVIPAGSQVHVSGKLKDVQVVECRSVTEAFRAVLGSGGG